MKRLLLLSGMIILGFAANINAMEDRPAPWREIDQIVDNLMGVDWVKVFYVLEKYDKTGDLVNEYRNRYLKMTLLELAIQLQNASSVRTLLRVYKAEPSQLALKLAEDHKEGWEEVVNMLIECFLS